MAEEGQRAQDASEVPSAVTAPVSSIDVSKSHTDSDSEGRGAGAAVSYFEREEDVDPKDM